MFPLNQTKSEPPSHKDDREFSLSHWEEGPTQSQESRKDKWYSEMKVEVGRPLASVMDSMNIRPIASLSHLGLRTRWCKWPLCLWSNLPRHTSIHPSEFCFLCRSCDDAGGSTKNQEHWLTLESGFYLWEKNLEGRMCKSLAAYLEWVRTKCW